MSYKDHFNVEELEYTGHGRDLMVYRISTTGRRPEQLKEYCLEVQRKWKLQRMNPEKFTVCNQFMILRFEKISHLFSLYQDTSQVTLDLQYLRRQAELQRMAKWSVKPSLLAHNPRNCPHDVHQRCLRCEVSLN